MEAVQAAQQKLRLAWALFHEPGVGWERLLLLGMLGLWLVYLLTPTDLIPDVVPLLGIADDAAALMVALEVFIHACPPDVVADARRRLGIE